MMSPKKIKSEFKFLATCGLFALPLGLSAADTTWNGASGGDYEVGSNWDTTFVPVNDLSTDNAILTGGEVVLNSDLDVGGLQMNAATTLSGTGTLRIGTSVGSTGFGLTGSEDLTLTGGGIDLSGGGTDTALNYTGDITVGAGTTLTSDRHNLKLDTGTHADTTITLDGGTIYGAYNHLDLAGRNIDLTVNGGTLFHKHARNFYNMSGQVISGAGQLTIRSESGTSGGRIELDGATNTYTGGTRLELGGHARISNDTALGLAGTSVTFNDGNIMFGGNVDFDTRALIIETGTYGQFETGGKIVTINGAISGDGELIVNGGGQVNLKTENNTYSGGTILDGVQVNLYGASNALGTDTITLDNGAIIKNRDNHPTLDNAITLGTGEGTYGGGTTGAKGGGQFEAGWNKSVTLNGLISGEGQLTFRSDSGNFTLSNTGNDYTGQTNIEGAVFAQTGVFGQNDGTAGDVHINGGTVIASNHLNFDDTRTITIDANGAQVIAYNNKAFTFDAVVDGTGAITVGNDGGSVRLLNGANTYSGGTEIQGLVNAHTGGFGTGDVTLNAVTAGRGFVQNFDAVAVFSNNFIISDENFGGNLKAGWSKNLTIEGVVSGAGDLTINGDSGTVILSNAANTFSGNVVLDAANSKLNVGSLESGSYAGLISGLGSLEYSGAGTQILTGANTYEGGTTLSGGVLSLNDAGALGTGPVTLASGSTLEINGLVIANELLNPNSGTLLNSGAAVDYSSNVITSDGGSLTVAGTGDVTLGEITRTENNPLIIKDGASTLTMTGAADNVSVQVQVDAGTVVLAKASSGGVHAVGGLLAINGGTAQLGGTGGDQIYDGSTVTLNGGTFDLNNMNEQIKFLNIDAGSIIGGTGTLTVNSFSGAGLIDARAGTVSVGIAGDAPLTKTTAGTVTLSGTVAYGGDTIVSEGTLSLSAANSVNDASTVGLATGGFLNLNFVGTDTVDRLFLNGVQQPAGVYGSGDTSLITGTGTLTVVSDPIPGYDAWITGVFENGTLPLDQQGANDDPDGDGISNLLEYAIDGQDPTVPNATIGSFVDGLLSFTKSATATGLTYEIQESTDFGDVDPWTEVSGVGYINNATTISYQLDTAAGVKNFIRLQVTDI